MDWSLKAFSVILRVSFLRKQATGLSIYSRYTVFPLKIWVILPSLPFSQALVLEDRGVSSHNRMRPRGRCVLTLNGAQSCGHKEKLENCFTGSAGSLRLLGNCDISGVS